MVCVLVGVYEVVVRVGNLKILLKHGILDEYLYTFLYGTVSCRYDNTFHCCLQKPGSFISVPVYLFGIVVVIYQVHYEDMPYRM